MARANQPPARLQVIADFESRSLNLDDEKTYRGSVRAAARRARRVCP
jgi:hypothetical protein